MNEAPFRVGDRVRVVAHSLLSEEEKRKHPCWIAEMNPLSGQEHAVSSVYYSKHNKVWIVELENLDCSFRPEWLTLIGVKQKTVTEPVKTKPVKPCSCTMLQLQRNGCICGAIKRYEQNWK